MTVQHPFWQVGGEELFVDVPVGHLFVWPPRLLTDGTLENVCIKSETVNGTVGWTCLDTGRAQRAFTSEMRQKVRLVSLIPPPEAS